MPTYVFDVALGLTSDPTLALAHSHDSLTRHIRVGQGGGSSAQHVAAQYVMPKSELHDSVSVSPCSSAPQLEFVAHCWHASCGVTGGVQPGLYVSVLPAHVSLGLG